MEGFWYFLFPSRDLLWKNNIFKGTLDDFKTFYSFPSYFEKNFLAIYDWFLELISNCILYKLNDAHFLEKSLEYHLPFHENVCKCLILDSNGIRLAYACIHCKTFHLSMRFYARNITYCLLGWAPSYVLLKA